MRLFLLLISITLLSITILLFYSLSTNQPSIFSIEAMFTFILLALIFLYWTMSRLYTKLTSFTSEISKQYESIEKLLFDLRDGTNLFYKERRREQRLKEKIHVKIVGKEGSCNVMSVMNVSKGGMRLKTGSPLNIGSVENLKVFLPVFPQPIDVRAKVVRSLPVTEGVLSYFDIGMEFLGISEDDKKDFTEWLKLVKNKQQ